MSRSLSQSGSLQVAPESATYASKANGINPNDVGWDLWPILGQSNNGTGIGLDATYQDTPDPRIWQFGGASGAGSGYYQKMILAVEPLFHQGAFASNCVGYAHRFAKSYLATVPANRRVLLVPCARASTGFTPTANYTWNPADVVTTNNLYNIAVAQIDAALAAAGPNSRVAGVLWHQGENDAGMATATYAAYLDSVIDALRVKYGSTLPFILGQMLPDTYVARNESSVHAAHAQTPGRKDYTGFVYGPTAAYNTDAQPPIHYNANGQRQLGDGYFAAYQRALTNHSGTVLASVPGTPVVTQSGGTPTAALVRWTPSTTKVTDYVIEYSRNAGAWTTWARTASPQADTAITGLAFGDIIKVRVKSVNANGTSAASADSNTLTLQTLLDKTGAAWRAYGLRQLKSTAPYAIKVRRSSDNTTQDIGFTGGLLNTAAMLTFCGAGDGFVDTWYDQSGNGRDLPQSTTTAQSQIVTAGAVNYLNNRPALRFAGAAYYESTTLGLYSAGTASMLAIASITTAANGKAVVAESSTTTAALYTHFALGSNLGQKMALTNDTPTSVFSSTAAAAFPANLQQVSTVDTGTNESGSRNGVAETPGTTYARSGVVTLNKFNVGAYYAGTGTLAGYSFWNGYITELVLFTSALSTAQRAAAEADQRAYSGTDYPPAP